MSKKSIESYEKEKGLMFKNVEDPSKKVTQEEFDVMVGDFSSWIGVDYEARVNFLKSNGYEVTRENLLDSSLSTRTS